MFVSTNHFDFFMGVFLTTSAQGNAYVLVMYGYDSNTINAVVIKNKKTASLIHGYNELYEELKKAGINPSEVIMS